MQENGRGELGRGRKPLIDMFHCSNTNPTPALRTRSQIHTADRPGSVGSLDDNDDIANCIDSRSCYVGVLSTGPRGGGRL